MQTVGNRSPFGRIGQRFNYDQLRAFVIAAMQFGINGAGKGFGIVRNDTHAGEAVSRGNVRVGHDVAFADC